MAGARACRKGGMRIGDAGCGMQAGVEGGEISELVWGL